MVRYRVVDHIFGQDQAIEGLRSGLRARRLHHAYIFHGPVGVGKCTTAEAFARVLLCHTAVAGQDNACGTCPSCQLLDRGADAVHPDLHIVTKELARFSDEKTIRDRKLTSIPVEILRTTLIDPVYLAARFKHNKVFIVDEAELLQTVGQNLLLKTLEEPPEGTYLILVTSNEDRLLPTVRSRCQRIAFAALTDTVVADWLVDQRVELSLPQRQWVLRFASGSVGRAQLVLGYDLLRWAAEISPAMDAMTDGRYPANLGATIAGMIDGFAKQWVEEHDNASKEAANRQGASLMFSLFARHAQQRLREIAGQCDAEDTQILRPKLEQWLGVIDALEVVEAEVAAHVNLGLVADHLVSLVYRSLAGRTIAA